MYLPGEPYVELVVLQEAVAKADIVKLLVDSIKDVHRLKWDVERLSHEIGLLHGTINRLKP